MWFKLPRLIRELAADDRGQDLIEYALLTAAIGLAGAATWPLITSGIETTYEGVNTATQNLWEVPDPQ
jgi:Flp pilus assembly pilin Flp